MLQQTDADVITYGLSEFCVKSIKDDLIERVK
jgi:hypothetical protein